MSVLDHKWCCLTCSAKFTMGEMTTSSPDGLYGMGCPKCKSGNMHCIEGQIIEVSKYYGEKGTIQ